MSFGSYGIYGIPLRFLLFVFALYGNGLHIGIVPFFLELFQLLLCNVVRLGLAPMLLAKPL